MVGEGWREIFSRFSSTSGAESMLARLFLDSEHVHLVLGCGSLGTVSVRISLTINVWRIAPQIEGCIWSSNCVVARCG